MKVTHFSGEVTKWHKIKALLLHQRSLFYWLHKHCYVRFFDVNPFYLINFLLTGFEEEKTAKSLAKTER